MHIHCLSIAFLVMYIVILIENKVFSKGYLEIETDWGLPVLPRVGDTIHRSLLMRCISIKFFKEALTIEEQAEWDGDWERRKLEDWMADTRTGTLTYPVSDKEPEIEALEEWLDDMVTDVRKVTWEWRPDRGDYAVLTLGLDDSGI